MGKRMIQGREVSDAQVQAWADEAEAGYDVEELQKRWRVSAPGGKRLPGGADAILRRGAGRADGARRA